MAFMGWLIIKVNMQLLSFVGRGRGVSQHSVGGGFSLNHRLQGDFEDVTLMYTDTACLF